MHGLPARLPLLALCCAPALALLRREPTSSHAGNGADAGAVRSVAICLVGEARVVACEPVLSNILRAMIDPIRAEADVFVALKPMSRHFGRPRCVPDGPNPEEGLRRRLTARLSPADVMFRGSGKNDSLGIRTAGVPCMRMIQERERRAGRQYRFVMHLRGDLVYPFALPAFAEWPRVGAEERMIFVEDCAQGNRPGDVCKLHYDKEPSRLGCTRDTWALMTRSVAPIYYQEDWDFDRIDREAMQRTGFGCVQHHVYQCGLGCALHTNAVTIRSLERRGVLLHNEPPRREVRVEEVLSLAPPAPGPASKHVGPAWYLKHGQVPPKLVPPKKHRGPAWYLKHPEEKPVAG